MSNGSVYWKPGEDVPPQLSFPPSATTHRKCEAVFLSAMLPRTIAWCSVDDFCVSLIDGYNAVCYTPPTLMMAASALPASFIETIVTKRTCSLSAASAHETSHAMLEKAVKNSFTNAFSFEDLNLKPVKRRHDYPATVKGSPILMHCRLDRIVNLTEQGADGDSMLLLSVDCFVCDGKVISDPSETMKNHNIIGRIDADLIQPWTSIGSGRFSQLRSIQSMSRPVQNKETGTWMSSKLEPADPSIQTRVYDDMEWEFQRDGRSCSLGFNPVTALVMPRPIGWISTYRKQDRTLHLAPYSFFTDVGRSHGQAMVAFAGFCPNQGMVKKDAQTDAEETGAFCCNVVTEELVVAMNYSAAELNRKESEFELASLQHDQAVTVDAPYVKAAKIRLECKYQQTVLVDSWSIVIGLVKAVYINGDILTDGMVDIQKLKPVTRLGYTNEYGLFSR